MLLVRTQFVRQLLRIERPAFGERVERQHRPDQRQRVREFALPDMARNRLVMCERG